eukprot:CAMPEP_0197078860 /NCGR_PEP_ID=MMETSP1384-20130603/213334_1 /TAXON_ID=29189 /ORGANISM="Ammonia sp." /LENGTH=168 /DNA_ID=CAMNT_0042517729 /DNA_START=369 /DNA_END=875 /DNA_ORIENTATION=-
MGNVSKNIQLREVCPDCSMKQLSSMICNAEKLDASNTVVVYCLQFESENATLRYCGIAHGCSLTVSLKFQNDCDLHQYASRSMPARMEDDSMIVFVRTIRGKCIWIACNPTDTAKQIRSSVYECEGIPMQQQRLMFGNKCMDEHQTLREQGLRHLDSVQLVLRLRGVF